MCCHVLPSAGVDRRSIVVQHQVAALRAVECPVSVDGWWLENQGASEANLSWLIGVGDDVLRITPPKYDCFASGTVARAECGRLAQLDLACAADSAHYCARGRTASVERPCTTVDRYGTGELAANKARSGR